MTAALTVVIEREDLLRVGVTATAHAPRARLSAA